MRRLPGSRAQRFGTTPVIGAFLAVWFLLAVAPPPERGRGVVAADHYAASEAGAQMLRRGGNAVDAAVAAALAAGVVQPAGSGLGGGGFAVVVDGERRIVLDFREVAPAKAHRDMFRTADGGVHPTASTVGGLAVAVPAEAVGLHLLLERYGKLSPRVVAEPAIQLASEGFAAGPHFVTSLGRTKYPEIRTLFSIDGELLTEDQRVTRPALARTLRQWVGNGAVLYTGPGAQAIVDTVRSAGGVLELADLASYAPRERQPIVASYRGYTVVTMPPPSSGGIALAQALRVLEGYELASLGHNSSDHLHLLTEVMKHAYADRAHHLGDPEFHQVPVNRLLSDARIGDIQRDIWPGRTFEPAHYGSLVAPPVDAGTEHISAVDAHGIGVALTTTINTSFGSGLVVEPLGIILNNQMDDFAAAPGVPNSYGLVGGDANAIAPGKRPLSSMSPTVLIAPDGTVALVAGASGGSQIISSVLQVVCNIVDFGMDPQEAVAAARIHHQWQPDELVVEPGIPKDVIDALEARGHRVVVREQSSSVQVVERDGELLAGGADPRKGGWPAGTW